MIEGGAFLFKEFSFEDCLVDYLFRMHFDFFQRRRFALLAHESNPNFPVFNAFREVEAGSRHVALGANFKVFSISVEACEADMRHDGIRKNYVLLVQFSAAGRAAFHIDAKGATELERRALRGSYFGNGGLDILCAIFAVIVLRLRPAIEANDFSFSAFPFYNRS